MNKIPTRKPSFEPCFQTASEPTPETAKDTKATKAKTKRKISPLKLREEFLNEIKNEGKYINE